MKIILILLVIINVFVIKSINSQINIGSVELISNENINTELCFNNTKLLSGKSSSDRFVVYYNSDTIFLNVLSNNTWSEKIAHTGNYIQSATLTFIKDTIWLCWREGNMSSARIKASYSSNFGNSWNYISTVSPIGNVSAPSIYASNNGKIHFVWHQKIISDTTVYHRVYYNGTFLNDPTPLSNINAQGQWPSVIAIGDTVLCAWKEGPLPTKVWFRSSFNGGLTWNNLSLEPTTSILSLSKDPNLAYSFDKQTNTHYVYLAFDGQNKIYIQRSNDFGITWSLPDTISNQNKASQFAHIESNNNGFVGITYEQRPIGTSLYENKNKDVGFTYSFNWGEKGSFIADSLAYTYNSFGSVYPSINKVDSNNYYIVWLTEDTINNIAKIFERNIKLNSTNHLISNQNESNEILLFPNPFSNVITLLSEKKLNNAKLLIINIQGKTLKEIENIYGNKIIINRENFQNGQYFFKLIQEENNIKTFKVSIID